MTKSDRQRDYYWHLSLWLPKDWRARIDAVRGEASINAWMKQAIEKALEGPHSGGSE